MYIDKEGQKYLGQKPAQKKLTFELFNLTLAREIAVSLEIASLADRTFTDICNRFKADKLKT